MAALVILNSNPQIGSVTTPLKLFLSLFWWAYKRLKPAEDLKSRSQMPQPLLPHDPATPGSWTDSEGGTVSS